MCLAGSEAAACLERWSSLGANADLSLQRTPPLAWEVLAEKTRCSLLGLEMPK